MATAYTWMNDNFQAGAATTIVLTTAVVDCNVNDLVIVRTSALGNQTPTMAGGSNTWVRDVMQQEATSVTTASVWSSVITTKMPIGTTVTCTVGASKTLRFIDGIVVRNLAGASVDGTGVSPAGQTATAMTTSSVTPTTTNWIAASINAYASAGTSVLPASGWTEDADTSAGEGAETQTIIGTTTTSMSAGGTGSGVKAHNQVYVVYKLTTMTALVYTKLGDSPSSSITTTVAAAIGDLVIIRLAGGGGGNLASMTGSNATDNQGNTFAVISGSCAYNSTAFVGCAVYWAVITHAMPIGTVITPSLSGQECDVIKVPCGSAAVNTSITHSGTGSGTAVTNTITGGPAELYVQVTGHAVASATPQGSWTEDTDVAPMETQTRVYTGGPVISGAATLNATSQWASGMAGWTMTAPAGATPAAITPSASDVTFTGTGSITANVVLALGNGTVSFSVVAGIATPAAIIPGTGTVAFAGSGQPTIPQAIGGTGSVGFSGSGTVSRPQAVVPATANVGFQGSGSITAPTSIGAGTGSVAFSGAGLVSRPQPVVPGTGSVSFAGSGSVTVPAAITPGAGSVSFQGAGAITSIPKVTGTGSVSFSGSGALSAPTFFTGTGSVGFLGTGTVTSIPRVTGTGSVGFQGTGALSVSSQVIPGAGSVSFAGSGNVTTPGSANIVPATANVGFSGAGSFTAPTKVTFGNGSVSFSGSGTVSAPALISFATVLATFSGSGSITSIPRVSGLGSVGFAGTGSIKAPTAIGTGSGSVSFAGAGTLGPIPVRLTGIGSVGFAATGSFTTGPTIPHVTGAANVGFAAGLVLFTPVLDPAQLEYARFILSRQEHMLRANERAFLLRALAGDNGALQSLFNRWRPLIPDIPTPDSDTLDDDLEEIARRKLMPAVGPRAALELKWQALKREGQESDYDADSDPQLGNWGNW